MCYEAPERAHEQAPAQKEETKEPAQPTRSSKRINEGGSEPIQLDPSGKAIMHQIDTKQRAESKDVSLPRGLSHAPQPEQKATEPLVIDELLAGSLNR